jgi:methylated-DNA-protein-cysteine methyltransferase-like protein
MDPAGRFELFYRVVRRVPRGRVTTYGQVALLAGMPGYARHVGHALAALRGTAHRVPWQRVLGKDGRGWARIAILDAMGAGAQRALLEREGVALDARGRVRLADFGWPTLTPRPAPASRARSRPRTRGSTGRS